MWISFEEQMLNTTIWNNTENLQKLDFFDMSNQHLFIATIIVHKSVCQFCYQEEGLSHGTINVCDFKVKSFTFLSTGFENIALSAIDILQETLS
jgi:hypothetical protein